MRDVLSIQYFLLAIDARGQTVKNTFFNIKTLLVTKNIVKC